MSLQTLVVVKESKKVYSYKFWMDVIWNKIPDELNGRTKWTSGADENWGWKGGGGSRQPDTGLTAAEKETDFYYLAG